MGGFHAELTLPNDVAGLKLAEGFVDQLVDMAGIGDDDGPLVVGAAVEACANVLDHAYEPGEAGTVRVSGDVDAAGLHLRIHDTGLKFDAGARLVPGKTRISEAGGLDRIRAAFDSVEWQNQGREGKELHLVKRRPSAAADVGDLEVVDDEESVPLAPEQEYEVRLFRPEDALGVCRTVYRNYGNTYFHEACYFPERMVALNETGELASVVAVAADGEIVGHYALERPNLTRVAERGMAVVAPAHRGRDLMTRMRTFIEEEAVRLGLIGVWSVAVTKHTYSQKVNETFKSDVCGLMLAGGPESQAFRGFDSGGKKPQRVSWVVYFTYVTPPEVALVHAPARHRAVLERIYESLELPVEWHDEVRLPQGDNTMDVTYSRELDAGTIRVTQVGEDTVVQVRRATEDLFGVTGAEVVFLDLPLADPSTPVLLEDLEDVGYFFSGVGPSFLEDGDALMMQCLGPDVELDKEQIAVANPFAAELVDYCFADRARVLGERPGP